MAELFSIPVEKIHPHPDNPRKGLGDLEELAASIKANGIFQNLTVVPNGDEYTVIIGHRRLAAAKKVGLLTVPCVIQEMTEQEQVKTMMVENMQRSDLTYYEQADGFQMMLDMGGTIATIAQETGISETTVRRRTKLCALDRDRLKQAVERGATLFDLDALNGIEDPDTRNHVLQYAGTTNFKNQLEKAKQGEKLDKKLAEWEHDIDCFAYRIDEKDTFHGKITPMKYVAGFGLWTIGKVVEVPADADDTRYFYTYKGKEITLYKDDPDASNALRDREKQRRYEDWLNRISAELEEIRQRHYKLRMDFVATYSGAKRHGEELVQVVINDMSELATYYKTTNWAIVKELLGIEAIEAEDDRDVRNTDKFLEQYTNNPYYLMLVLLYARTESKGGKYYQKNWNQEQRRFVIQHGDYGNIGKVYVLLAALDYEMCDEEVQMADGTHPLFQEKFDEG